METLRSLNHHALVVLRGRPDAPVTDARSAALAAEAQEANELLTDASKPNDEHGSAREAKDAVAAASVALEDLVDATAAPPKTLRIDDPSRYFASVAEETTPETLDAVSKKRRATPFEFGDAVARAAVAMRFDAPLANENETGKKGDVDGDARRPSPPRRAKCWTSSPPRRGARRRRRRKASGSGPAVTSPRWMTCRTRTKSRSVRSRRGSARRGDGGGAPASLWTAAPLTSVRAVGASVAGGAR